MSFDGILYVIKNNRLSEKMVCLRIMLGLWCVFELKMKKRTKVTDLA